MTGYRLLYLASLITYTFGALAFPVLSLFYWRERRRHGPAADLVFPAFTLVCAAAFLTNLALRGAAAAGLDSPWVTALSFVLELATGTLAPLLLHLIFSDERPHLPRPRAWDALLATFYIVSVAAAALHGLAAAEIVTAGWTDRLDSTPALMLCVAGSLGLLMQAMSRRRLGISERRQRLLYRILLCLAVVCAVLNLAHAVPFSAVLADYLLLAFFSVTLYYRQRLVFFDLLIKRGAFFCLGLVGLTLLFALAPRAFEGSDWSRPLVSALLLTPLWLMGPWLYRRLGAAIDRRWLKRRYSGPEAERRFIHDLQAADTEEDLRACATRSLGAIFDSPAEVRFVPPPAPLHDAGGGLAAPLEQHGESLGWIGLSPKPNGTPFLSDDRNLVQSLARTLSVVLENVRFRQQQRHQEEREQQLRWLAGRAELKALRAQINPHFLFNALNAIAGLIPDRPQLADETVEQLAQVFRYTLRKSEKEWVRFDEEIEFVTAYLRVEQARFGERLQVELDVDSAAAEIPVPAMSIQPLVENAIQHGVAAVEGRGMVGLRAALETDALEIVVSDNGPGFPPGFSLGDSAAAAAGGGHALRNIAERLRGYYGDSAQLRWESSGERTRVWLRIPRTPPPEAVGRYVIDTRADRRR